MPKDNSYPAFLFNPEDFASDGKVEMMTTEEVGAYILLLCKAWREEPAGTLPDNDSVLARWARLPLAKWIKCRVRVTAAFYKEGDGRLHQKRMKQEYVRMQATKQKRATAAQKAAEARWSDDAVAMRNASESHTNGISQNTIVHPNRIEEKEIEGNVRESLSPKGGESVRERAPAPDLPAGLIDHPTMRAYWTRFRVEDLPATGTQERAIAAVTDATLWQTVLDYWRDNKYRPESLGKMVTCYIEGGPRRLQQGENNGGNKANHTGNGASGPETGKRDQASEPQRFKPRKLITGGGK